MPLTPVPAAVLAKRTVPLVLVADDDEDILTLVALRFRRSGLEVILARDGEEALELIQKDGWLTVRAEILTEQEARSARLIHD